MPSLVVAVVVLVGFGAWGLLSPTAPKGWDNPAEKVIVGSESTTRYVVLNTKDANGKKALQLHPILNLASAKLLLDPQKFGVVKVKESVLDESGIQHGATIGIPYAPDRLPGADDAGTAKYWALCETPGGGTDKQSQKAVFILDKGDQGKVGGNGQLTAKEAMYVEGPDGAQYLVSSQGGRYLLGGDDWRVGGESRVNFLRRVVFGEAAVPQKVSAEWLSTLIPAGSIDFPRVDGAGTQSTADLIPDYNKVGLVLQTNSGPTVQNYVVLKDRVAPVSDFTARLLLNSRDTDGLYPPGTRKAVNVPLSQINPTGDFYYAEANWPEEAVKQANTQEEGTGRNVACGVYHGKNNELKATLPEMSMWAGKDFPITIAQSGTNTYVSSGSGLLFRQVNGTETGGGGSIYLVTDTGLRYSVPATNDSDVCGAATEENSKTNAAQVRLGYEKNTPVPVPQVWSQLLASGPTLATEGACQAQGS